MNRCVRCSAPLPEGVYCCLPSRSLDGTKKVKFNGCSVLREPTTRREYGAAKNGSARTGFVRVKKHLTAKEEEPSFEVHAIPLSGEMPLWMIQLHCRSTPRYDKYAAGSVWTNQHYGFGWSIFSRKVRRIAREQRIVLVGLHVPTIALADLIEKRLLDRN